MLEYLLKVSQACWDFVSQLHPNILPLYHILLTSLKIISKEIMNVQGFLLNVDRETPLFLNFRIHL